MPITTASVATTPLSNNLDFIAEDESISDDNSIRIIPTTTTTTSMNNSIKNNIRKKFSTNHILNNLLNIGNSHSNSNSNHNSLSNSTKSTILTSNTDKNNNKLLRRSSSSGIPSQENKLKSQSKNKIHISINKNNINNNINNYGPHYSSKSNSSKYQLSAPIKESDYDNFDITYNNDEIVNQLENNSSSGSSISDNIDINYDNIKHLRLSFKLNHTNHKLNDLMDNVTKDVPSFIPFSNLNQQDPFEVSASIRGGSNDPQLLRKNQYMKNGIVDIPPPTMSIELYSEFIESLINYRKQLKVTAEAAESVSKILETINNTIPSTRHSFEQEYDDEILKKTKKQSKINNYEENKLDNRQYSNLKLSSNINPSIITDLSIQEFIQKEKLDDNNNKNEDLLEISKLMDYEMQIKSKIVDYRLDKAKTDVNEFIQTNRILSNIMDQWSKDIKELCEEPLKENFNSIELICQQKNNNSKTRLKVLDNLINLELNNIQYLKKKNKKGNLELELESSKSKCNHLQFESNRLKYIMNHSADFAAQDFSPFLFRCCHMSLQTTTDNISLLHEGIRKIGMNEYYYIDTQKSIYTIKSIEKIIHKEKALKQLIESKKQIKPIKSILKSNDSKIENKVKIFDNSDGITVSRNSINSSSPSKSPLLNNINNIKDDNNMVTVKKDTIQIITSKSSHSTLVRPRSPLPPTPTPTPKDITNSSSPLKEENKSLKRKGKENVRFEQDVVNKSSTNLLNYINNVVDNENVRR